MTEISTDGKPPPRRAFAALQRSVTFAFSILLMLAGTMLLISGALPAIPEHIDWLEKLVPLPLLEASHLVGSLVGVFLLVLARAVRLRLDAAYYSSIAVLLLGIAASLFKGFDWHEALILAAMLVMFLPTRKYFNRQASIFTISFPPEWIALIALALGLSLFLGLEAYRHIDYAHDLFWRFSYRDDAPRFLRAGFVTILFVFGYAAINLLNVARLKTSVKPTPEEIEQAQAVAASSHDTSGFLALLGDKSLLWGPQKKAFIMYAVTPRYWIAMGDPVGDPAEYPELVWRFREMADLHAAHAAFYETSDQFLPLYLDRGFTLLKMGEEARIPLQNFSLQGGKRENMRKQRNKFIRQEFVFRLLEKEEVEASLPILRAISDRWVKNKNTHEKSFSLGFFSEEYLRHTRIAVIEKDGRIYAFANFWELDGKREIALDLMRYDPDSPPSVMEYLFVESILWAKNENYAWFGLGMAPLSGMEDHPLAPLWHKIGRVIYSHGEDFYNFEGLQAYKSKFDPVWRPRYLAAPPGPHIPLILISVARIIAGGFRGIFRK